MRLSTRFKIALLVLQVRGRLQGMINQRKSPVVNRLLFAAVDVVTAIHNRIRWVLMAGT